MDRLLFCDGEDLPFWLTPLVSFDLSRHPAVVNVMLHVVGALVLKLYHNLKKKDFGVSREVWAVLRALDLAR
jgi:hypothetical protein